MPPAACRASRNARPAASSERRRAPRGPAAGARLWWTASHTSCPYRRYLARKSRPARHGLRGGPKLAGSAPNSTFGAAPSRLSTETTATAANADEHAKSAPGAAPFHPPATAACTTAPTATPARAASNAVASRTRTASTREATARAAPIKTTDHTTSNVTLTAGLPRGPPRSRRALTPRQVPPAAPSRAAPPTARPPGGTNEPAGHHLPGPPLATASVARCGPPERPLGKRAPGRRHQHAPGGLPVG